MAARETLPSGLRAGAFVWSHFPYSENPYEPGPLHVGYVAFVEREDPERGRPPMALIAYTTTSPRRIAPARFSGRPGEFLFSQQEAKAMGQCPKRGNGFLLDMRTLTLVPVTSDWIANLNKPGGPVIGHLPPTMQRKVEASLASLIKAKDAVILRQNPSPPARPAAAAADDARPARDRSRSVSRWRSRPGSSPVPARRASGARGVPSAAEQAEASLRRGPPPSVDPRPRSREPGAPYRKARL